MGFSNVLYSKVTSVPLWGSSQTPLRICFLVHSKLKPFSALRQGNNLWGQFALVVCIGKAPEGLAVLEELGPANGQTNTLYTMDTKTQHKSGPLNGASPPHREDEPFHHKTQS